MGEFLRYISETPVFPMVAMIVFLSITLVFLYNKLYKYALMSALLFAMAFGLFMTSPMGEDLIKKFKKRERTFHFPDQKEIDEARKKIREHQ